MKESDWNTLLCVVKKAIARKKIKIHFNSPKVNTITFGIGEALISLEVHKYFGSLDSSQISLYSSKYPSLLLERHYDIVGKWVAVYDKLVKIKAKQQEKKKEKLRNRVIRKLFSTYTDTKD